MKIFFLLFSFLSLGLSTVANSNGDHDKKTRQKATEKAGHIEKDSHKDHDDHDESEKSRHASDKNEEDENKNVGPNKGVTSFDEEKGFSLSEEAKKTFSIQTQKLNGPGPWSLPQSALLFMGEEKNVYRLRDGFFKRVDIESIKKDKDNKITVKSESLKIGDSVVVQGVGFIRIAEVDATSVESGHGH